MPATRPLARLRHLKGLGSQRKEALSGERPGCIDADPSGNGQQPEFMIFGCYLLAQIVCATVILVLDIGETRTDLLALQATSVDAALSRLSLTLLLFVCTVVAGFYIRAVFKRIDRQTERLRISKGACAEVIHERLASWKLSPAERDIAFLALKGCSTSDIAAIRDAKQATIRSQFNSVYRKAGVRNRVEFVCLFTEGLFAFDKPPYNALPAVGNGGVGMTGGRSKPSG